MALFQKNYVLRISCDVQSGGESTNQSDHHYASYNVTIHNKIHKAGRR